MPSSPAAVTRPRLAAHARAFVAALLLVAPALLVAGGARGAGDLILRVGTDQNLGTLNPWNSYSVADYEIFQVQYEMLVGFGNNLEAVPGFADRWESSADKTTHTFHIREGMKWSDGAPATCEDARYTYQTVIDATTTEATLGSDYLPPYLTNAGLKAVTCTDPQTLVVTTEFPTTLLTQAYVPILPKHVWSKYSLDQIGNSEGKDFFQNPPPVVGSGPYVAVDWKPGEFIRMNRNPNYWGKPGVPEAIIFQEFANTDTMVQALRNGELDYVRGVGADQFDKLATEPNIRVAEGFSNGYTYLSFNSRGNKDGYHGSTSALADQKFRDALGFAIDRKTLVEKVLNGHGVPGTTHIPPYQVNWHVEPDRPRTFDIAEANRRLDAAGYKKNADGKRLDAEGKVITLRLTWPDSEDHAADAQFIQGWFEQIGIGVDAFQTEQDTLYSDLAGPEADPPGEANWDFYMWGWTGDPDPMSELSFFVSDEIPTTINDCFYSNPRYDELFKLQQRATDVATRKQYIAEMQQLFYDFACYHVLYYDSELHAMRTDKFTGWVNQPPDSGTPLFGYGYSGYMALTDASLVPTPGPTVLPTAAASGTPATPAPTAAPSNAGTGVSAPVLIGGIVVIVVVIAGFLLLRRRGTAREEE